MGRDACWEISIEPLEGTILGVALLPLKGSNQKHSLANNWLNLIH